MTSCAPKPAAKRSSDTIRTRYHIPRGMYKSSGAFSAPFDLGRPPDVVEAFQARPSWNYTTFLNFEALAVAVVLGWRFLRTGGLAMLRMMDAPPTPSMEMSHHD